MKIKTNVKYEEFTNNIKNLLRSYNSWSEPFCKYIKELGYSLKLIFKDTPYHSFIEKVLLKYELIVSEIDQLNKTISKLYGISQT